MKVTQEQFEKSMEEIPQRDIEGNRYNFEKAKYVHSKQKVIVTCKIHGEFEALPNNLSRGSGCNTCGYIRMAEKRASKAKKVFLDRCLSNPKLVDVNGDHYIFEKSEYKSTHTKLTVICKIHGDFGVTPHDLHNGYGCPRCGVIRSAETKIKKAKKEFKTRANKIHDNKYDYSTTIYIANKTKLEIICPKHGSFWQTANSHLSGRGCRACSDEALTGSNNPRWVNDRSLVAPPRVNGIHIWAREVKKGITHCDFCKKEIDMSIRKNKVAHHLNAYASYPEQRLDVNNGVVMDKKCHKLVHKICGSGHNTAKGYYELRELYRVLNKI